MFQTNKSQRSDLNSLWLGIAFSTLFTGLIWLIGQRLMAIPHLPDTGPSWYYWMLPQQTLAGQLSAWGFYLAHQFSIWGLIYYAQRQRALQKVQYTTNLHSFNYAALGLNAFFIILHLIQTHVWYDGLAQDVSIWSSQASVVLMLVLILLMENPRRGLFFGKKVPFSKRVIGFVRKYHGYIFSWGIIYTFWYHPMEITTGHLIGFFYTFLLLLQGSLFFTRIHRNRWWTFTQEALVLVHGALVAVMQANNMWPMFGFGFAGLIVITQLHGLGLSRWIRAMVIGFYTVSALWVYNGRGWDKLEEVIRIPIIEYLIVFILALLIWLGIWITQKVGNLFRHEPIESV